MLDCRHQIVEGQHRLGAAHRPCCVLFSLYNEKAADHDQRLAEKLEGGWAAAQGVMFLTSLISASRRIPFTVLFYFSAKLLRRLSPVSRPHLQIQVSSNPSSNAQRPPSPPIPAFPSTVTNVFLLARLELSLAAAMFATLVQKWVRRYLRLTQLRYSPHRRSRIRACMMKE
ncbi:hypothetical protein BJV74DRAFT_247212 [Russula compacta]|nr:hypothetical protein BJV74DRAFT_247212 [Russula compacta]